MENTLLQYGIAGAGLIGLSWFIIYQATSHKKERDEWRQDMKEDRKESNQNIKDNTNILSGLKTLLEHQNKK